jgi:hypothetical protein
MPADIIGYSYAAIVAGGGVMGYVKSGKLEIHDCHSIDFSGARNCC